MGEPRGDSPLIEKPLDDDQGVDSVQEPTTPFARGFRFTDEGMVELSEQEYQAALIADQTKPMSIEEMPVDDPRLYFEWLQRYHDWEYIRHLPSGTPQPEVYDYTGIKQQEVDEAIRALKNQRSDDIPGLRRLLAGLSPVEIMTLAESPFTKLYLTEERDSLARERQQRAIERLSQSQDVQELIRRDEFHARYAHATRSEDTARGILTSGLNCHVLDGLAGVAVNFNDEPNKNLAELASTHRGYPFVIIVALPKLPPDIHSKLVELRSRSRNEGVLGITQDVLFVENLAQPFGVQGEISYDGKIPARYVQGYLDTTTGLFHRNPKFNSEFNPTDRAVIENRLQSPA